MFARLALVAPALAAVAFGGCAVSLQPPPAAVDEDVTASIAPTPAPEPGRPAAFATLDDEDWRRAEAALATALDPQGNGALTPWENAQTKRRGGFAAAGPAHPVEDSVCRPFVAGLAGPDGETRLVGSACRDKRGEWTVREARKRGG